MQQRIASLPARGVVEVAGPDRVAFLQGLVSADVAAVAPGRAAWSALLTPQGKYLHDFFVVEDGGRLLLDCVRAEAGAVAKRLARYRLRSQVTVEDVSTNWLVYVEFGVGEPSATPPGAICFADPRLPDAGLRVLSPSPLAATASADDYDAHRLALGLPDGPPDLEVEATVLMEAGFDELGGISWTKGCWMGQELTARTRYRGLVKRRLVPVEVSGELPPSGTPITSADGAEVGLMRSGRGSRGLALLRTDALMRGQPMTSAGASVVAHMPDWFRLVSKP